MSMDVHGLLADEERGWLALTLVFGDVPPDRFDEPSVTDEGWSPKDVMYHVAAWSEEAAKVLGRIAAGTHREGDPDVQALNEAWFEESGPRHYAEHLPDLRSFLERGTHRP